MTHVIGSIRSTKVWRGSPRAQKRKEMNGQKTKTREMKKRQDNQEKALSGMEQTREVMSAARENNDSFWGEGRVRHRYGNVGPATVGGFLGCCALQDACGGRV